MSTDRPISKDDLAVLLASALGQDKSDEVVSSAARSLGLARSSFSGEETRAIFETLVKAEGLVGVVARFAISRGDVEKLVVRGSPRPVAPVVPPVVGRLQLHVGGSTSVSPSRAPPPIIDLMPFLAPALGAEKARDAIEAAAARHGVDVATGLSHAEALVVLDEIARIDGIVGVVARFAKARFLLIPG